MSGLLIERISLADQVARVLRQRLMTGDLRPGAPLFEVPLASELNVSRNTVREAIRILSLENLVKRNAHRGVTVARLSPEDLQEIYHLRRFLEIPAVHAAKERDPEVLAEMGAVLDEYEKAVFSRDWIAAVDFDFRFHVLLIRFHRSKRLELFYKKVIGELQLAMVLIDRSHENPQILVPAHREIYQLLAAGELERCADVLAQHLSDSGLRIGELLDRQAEQ